MNQSIIKYIHEELLGDSLEEEIRVEEDLLNSGLIDSLGLMRLIAFIEEEHSIKVPPQDMVIENFISVEAIGNYILSKAS